MLQANVIRLRAQDNVVVARLDLRPGEEIAAERCTLQTAVPLGHKVSTAAIPRNAAVIKYGEAIGRATRDIQPGEHVHVHNLAFSDAQVAATPGVATRPTVYRPQEQRATFEGFARPSGRVGTRNYVGISPASTVLQPSRAISPPRSMARPRSRSIRTWTASSP